MSYLGEKIPKLGFGLMRLPMADGEVDLPQVKAMVDTFLAAGFTYFDTAYGYLNGKSEQAVKPALVERYPRESFQLATKLPAFVAKSEAEAKAMFQTSLDRTGAGYFDFFLLHNLGDDRTANYDAFGIWDFLKEKKARGLIRHLGFSFHDKAAVLDKLLTAHPDMDFVQLQINYTDWEDPQVESRLCYETARRHGKPVIIMEPIKGGSLATVSPTVEAVFRQADPLASPAGWALRFAASLDGLITVLSGMSTLEQMKENVAMMKDFVPLNSKEQEVIRRARETYQAIEHIPCTDCRYCVKGCPQGVVIPRIFKAMNNYLLYNNLPGARGNYGWETRNGGQASLCVGCGQCEGVCPQHIHIIDELARATELLEKKA